MKRNNKLIVLSADAMVTEDLALLRTLPNFRKYLSGGAELASVRSIYPTITYPVHTSIATGCYPDRHGILGNLDFTVGRHVQPRQWDHRAVRIPDIFDAAKKAGLSTAAVFWPVTGNHPSIDYLVDEFWTQGPEDTHEKAFRRMGTDERVMRIVRKYESSLIDRVHPFCDHFAIHVAADIIATYAPDLIMIHPADIDAYRHQSGAFGSKVRHGIEDTDLYIGLLMEAAEKAGVLGRTNFCLVSDHGQMDIVRVMNLNVKLVQNGLIRLDGEGEIRDWDAYVLSGGLSALVYLKDPEDQKTYAKVYNLFRDLCAEGVYGIGRVFTEEEAQKEERYGGDFSFVLETDGYTSFADSWTGPLVTPLRGGDYRTGRATHGYLPDKGPQPVFVAKGPAFKENVRAGRRPIVDETATFARVLGLDMPGIDGKCIEEILR